MSIVEISTLVKKEIKAEWRQRYAINGMILYLAGTIFVCYMSFTLKSGTINAITWNALFWIIILFTSVNSVAKSFIQESAGRQLYFYAIASPEGIVLSKMIYNALLSILMASLGLVMYSLVMSDSVVSGIIDMDYLYYSIAVVLGTTGFATCLTMVSAIAAKAKNSTALVAVLSFPVLIPLILLLIKLSRNAMEGLDRASNTDEILSLLAINAITISISYVLFPYLWRS